MLQLSVVWCNFSQSLCFPGRASAKLLGASAIIITITLIVILIFIVTLPIILSFSSIPSNFWPQRYVYIQIIIWIANQSLFVHIYLSHGHLEIHFSSQLNDWRMWSFRKAGWLNILKIWLGPHPPAQWGRDGGLFTRSRKKTIMLHFSNITHWELKIIADILGTYILGSLLYIFPLQTLCCHHQSSLLCLHTNPCIIC